MLREALENQHRMTLWRISRVLHKTGKGICMYKLRWVWRGRVVSGTVTYQSGQIFDYKLQGYSVRISLNAALPSLGKCPDNQTWNPGRSPACLREPVLSNQWHKRALEWPEISPFQFLTTKHFWARQDPSLVLFNEVPEDNEKSEHHMSAGHWSGTNNQRKA